MPERTYEYQGKELLVRWNSQRCTHAAECVTRLAAVFDKNVRPWVQPDNAPAADVAQVVIRCPTGALHFEPYADLEPEATPSVNVITEAFNGPLYVRGNLEIIGSDGHVILQDTRVALCRCGQSNHKPFCDNSHLEANFTAPGTFRQHGPAPIEPGKSAEKLTITIEANGPYFVEGEMEIYGPHGNLVQKTNEALLCRCGGSADKPFCDNSHRILGFTAE